MVQPGTWISRTLAIAILVLVVLSVHSLVIMPLLDRYRTNEQRIAQMTNLLQRYRDLDATRPALEDRLAELQGLDDAARGYWEGESDVLTATELQDRASQAVFDSGGNVISMQPLDPVAAEDGLPIHRTSLRMRLATSIDGLATTVHDIETAVPYMFIDRLIITPARSRQSFRNDDEPSDEQEKLDVRLDVFGYVRERRPVVESAGASDG